MLRISTPLLFLFLAFIHASSSGRVRKRDTRSHEQFVPQVAFKCGYRNQYLNAQGAWVTDADPSATCKTERPDILAYCKRVYPGLDVTNYVEGGHNHLVENWCREGGRPCKWQFWVKPYRCIVGEFESEALLVPNGCQFGHVDDRNKCEEFQHWNDTAHAQCAKKSAGLTRVRSFSILEPCGLDKFSGVEYVCCPPAPALDPEQMHVSAKVHRETTVAVPELTTPAPSTTTTDKGYWDKSEDDEESVSDDDDDDDDEDDDDDDAWDDGDDDDDDDEDDEDSSDDVTIDEDSEDDDDDDWSDLDDHDPNDVIPRSDEHDSASEEDKAVVSFQDDPYFREADPTREHERFKAALRRHDRRHKNAISKVMKEREVLETKYQKMTETDPEGAKKMRKQMTVTFQKQIATLEDRSREQRREIDDIHQQRWRAVLNERKREAMKGFRDVLTADHPVAHKILQKLEAYLRAEEKDRVHSINHYRHLLRSDPDMALEWRPDLVTRLEDIDYRVNGTLDMLKDTPTMDEKIRPVALEYWITYRRENTPEIVPDELLSLATLKNDDRLLQVFDDEADAFLKEDEEFEDERAEEPELSPFESTPSKAVKDTHFVDRAAYTSEVVGGLRSGSALPVVLACGGALLLLILVLTVVLLRRKHSAAGQGFMQVDACTPEEKHVAAMQINGYENPTYAHFEKP